MTDRPPTYASDFIPAPLDRARGETEAMRCDRLHAESEARLRAHVASFPGKLVPSDMIVEAPPARFYDLGPWRE